ncbi:MAG: Gfo/Idh/MocA family oxidoreductase [Bryobacterales bacterium]|nr:Gfo/Idh/MocA family oxidoreductase [Bryobacterales bacterium]
MTDRSLPSRRTLLGAGATGVFSIVGAQAVRGSEANSKVSVALIGAGNRGSYDAGIVHRDPRAHITALCDKFDDRLESSAQKIGVANPKTYKDFEKVLGAGDIDAVIIATPPFEHPRMLAAAVDARKHVYCEKPMGVDYEGAKTIIAAGRRADPRKCISVGFQQRYGPVYLEALKRLRNGEIGDISTARAAWIDKDPFQRKQYDPAVEKLRNWFCYRDYSGDIIVEQDCHNLDVLHWFLDALPVRAIGYGGRKVRTTMDILDHLTVVYEWPNGIHVNFEANQLTPRGFSRIGEEFTGTKGTLLTSRKRMQHIKSVDSIDTIDSQRDITNDALETFIERIVTANPENVAERSALSTMIGFLGREAIYTGREITWKGFYGA